MKRLLMAILPIISMSATAESTVQEIIQKKISEKGETAPVTNVELIEGGKFYAFSLGGELFFSTLDAKYFIRGDVIDSDSGESLGMKVRYRTAMPKIKEFVSSGKSITYEHKAEEKLDDIYIMFDTSCHFCEKMHGELDRLLESGISVHYIPFPRSGTVGDIADLMAKVWCAENKNEALDLALKNPSLLSTYKKTESCEKIIAEGYEIAQTSYISGTPQLYLGGHEVAITGYRPSSNIISIVNHYSK